MNQVFKALRDFFARFVNEQTLPDNLVGGKYYRILNQFGIRFPMEIEICRCSAFNGIKMFECNVTLFQETFKHTYTEKELKNIIFVLSE